MRTFTINYGGGDGVVGKIVDFTVYSARREGLLVCRWRERGGELVKNKKAGAICRRNCGIFPSRNQLRPFMVPLRANSTSSRRFSC